ILPACTRSLTRASGDFCATVGPAPVSRIATTSHLNVSGISSSAENQGASLAKKISNSRNSGVARNRSEPPDRSRSASGPKASEPDGARQPRMSAFIPIATEFQRCGELSRCAKRRHSHCSRFFLIRHLAGGSEQRRRHVDSDCLGARNGL